MCRRLHPEMLSVEDWLVKQGVRDLPVPKVQVLQKGVAAMLQRLMREDNPLIEGQGGEQRLDRRAALGLALSTAWGAGSVLPALCSRSSRGCRRTCSRRRGDEVVVWAIVELCDACSFFEDRRNEVTASFSEQIAKEELYRIAV